jgi:hypothetical protein
MQIKSIILTDLRYYENVMVIIILIITIATIIIIMYKIRIGCPNF